MPFAAAVGAVGAVAGGLISASGAKSAASTSAAAANNSAQVQQNMFNTTEGNLQPYISAGEANLPSYSNFYNETAAQGSSALNAAIAQLPGNMTQAYLQSTPGYQFTQQQGLRATQNANAASGLGISGAAITGASQYATGLANQTYAQQLQNQNLVYQDYLQNFNATENNLQNIYNQLGGPVSIGESAAAGLGNTAVQSGANIGNSLQAAGNAAAAGTVGSSNALSGTASNLGGLGYLAAQNSLNSSGSGFVDNTSTFDT